MHGRRLSFDSNCKSLWKWFQILVLTSFAFAYVTECSVCHHVLIVNSFNNASARVIMIITIDIFSAKSFQVLRFSDQIDHFIRWLGVALQTNLATVPWGTFVLLILCLQIFMKLRMSSVGPSLCCWKFLKHWQLRKYLHFRFVAVDTSTTRPVCFHAFERKSFSASLRWFVFTVTRNIGELRNWLENVFNLSADHSATPWTSNLGVNFWTELD